MSDILSIGASGVRAYQTALGVVSENIANASTTGYVRRNPTIVESSLSGSTIAGQLERRILGGVLMTGVSRQSDAFRVNDVRLASSDVAGSETGVAWLSRIEGALSSSSLGTRLTGFFNAATALAADASGTAARTEFLAQADAAAGAFRGTATALGALGTELAQQAGQSVDALNGLSANLAQINQSLSRAQPGTNAQAALLDQRDRILDEMSSLATIAVETTPTGAATVRLNQAGGPLLVEGPNAARMSVTVNASGSIAYTLDPYGTPSTVAPSGGALAGLADAAARIADAHAQIDAMAGDFGTQLNAVQAMGVDQDGASGGALFAFDADDPAATIAITTLTARGIAAAGAFVSATSAGNTGTGAATLARDPGAAGLPAGASYRFTVSGGTVTITDPASAAVLATLPYVAGQAIAGAGFSLTLSGVPADGDSFTVSASAAGSRDNANLQAIAALRSSGRYEARLDALVTNTGSALASRRTLAETHGAIRDNAVDARSTISGVNLDDEAVELMKFQQAYQASSRIIQVAREMFQSIIDVV